MIAPAAPAAKVILLSGIAGSGKSRYAKACESAEGALRGVVAVVDNTNTTAMELAPYYAVARAYGFDVEIVTVLCPAAVAAARNSHGVPLAGCERMAASLAARELPPYWEVTLTTVDAS